MKYIALPPQQVANSSLLINLQLVARDKLNIPEYGYEGALKK
jgi:hypothetical protein